MTENEKFVQWAVRKLISFRELAIFTLSKNREAVYTQQAAGYMHLLRTHASIPENCL